MSKTAITTLAVVIIIGVVGIGFWIVGKKQQTPMATNKSSVPAQSASSPISTSTGEGQPQKLAGSSSPLYAFSKTVYDQAVASDKLIVLYFYANWCPICRAEFPRMEAVFNELKNDEVIGFRVNFNDDETDQDEKELAKQFAIAYQHTKVFLKKGQVVGKSFETWTKERYIAEINKAAYN